LFGGGDKPVMPPPAPSAMPPQMGGFGSATQSFQTPQFPQAAPAQPSGPSEYTRLFSAPKEPQAPPPPPVAVAAPPAAKPFPKWPIFVFVAIIILLLIGLIVTLVRK
jgi:hypothetical protein